MEDNFNKKPEQTVQKTSKQEPSAKMKKKKAKKAIITLSTIVVLFLGLQVYASVNGYGNVFFMIKNLITTGNPVGTQEIFSDKDITLSYKSIEVAEGLKIQANRLEIKDGKTKLFLSVKSENYNYLPLKYDISTTDNTGKLIKDKTRVMGIAPENDDDISYEEVLTLDYEVGDNDIIIIKVIDVMENELRTLEINLQTREITVKGEKDFEKISEIELKKYLGMFSEVSRGDLKANGLLYIAQRFQNNYQDFMKKEDYENAKKTMSDREFKNSIIKEFYGENAEFVKENDKEVLKGITAWEYDKQNDAYKELTAGEDYHYGRCLQIQDINFENDIYTVKYVFLLANEYDENDGRLEELPQYETTIKLKRNENNKYSKYTIISLEEGTEVKNKVSTDVNNKVSTDVNNKVELKQSSAGAWYTIDLYENNEMEIRFTSKDYDKIFGNDYIDRTIVHTITGINGKISKIYQANNGTSVDPMTFFLLEDGTVQYILPFEQMINGVPEVFKVDGTIEQVKNVVDIKTNENDVVIAVLKNGTEMKIWNEWMDWSEEEQNTNVTTNINEQTSSNVWKEFNTLNNARIKMPENFISLNEKYDYERYKTQYFEGAYFGGKIKVKYDVTLSSNMYPGSEAAKSYLGNNDERMVESKDDNGWTNWYPISDASRMLNNGFERKYGRVGNGQFEEVTFTYDGIYSCGVEQYKFMSDVLSSVNSRGIN